MDAERVSHVAGCFLIAAPLDGHPAGTATDVEVLTCEPSTLLLDFEECQGITADAESLLCGHVGAGALTKLGYTGPLIIRPRLADSSYHHDD